MSKTTIYERKKLCGMYISIKKTANTPIDSAAMLYSDADDYIYD